MLTKKRIISLISILILLWSVFSWFMRSLSFGFYFEPNTEGMISLQQTFVNEQTATEPQSTKDGYASFEIDPTAKHFNFHFMPMGSPYQIKAMALWGIPLFKAVWIWEKIKPSQPLYKQVTSLSKGDYLPFHITDEVQTVDYIRFFDSLLKTFRFVRLFGSIVFASLITVLLLFLLKGDSISKVITNLRLHQSLLSALNNKLFFLAATIVILLLSLPPPVLPIETGADPSWISILNHLAFKKMFGSSAVFTYGPLGFILVPQAIGFNVITALLANLFQLALLGFIYAFLFKQDLASRHASWCLLLCHLIPTRIPEWQWTALPLILIVTVCLSKTLPAYITIVLTLLSAGLCVFVSLMKFSSCLLIFSTSFMAITYLFLTEPRKALRITALYSGAFSFAGLFASLTLFDSFPSFLDWIYYSLQIASGYNLYMIVNKSWGELLLPFLYLLITLGALLWRMPNFWKKILRFCIFAPLFFMLIKYAITRQHIEPLLFIGPLVTSLWMLDANHEWRRRLVHLFGCQLILSFLLSWLFIVSGSSSCPLIGLSPRNLLKTIRLHETIRLTQQISTDNLAAAKLPESWISQIATNRIQSLPLEYAYTFANQLNAIPFYTFQGYSCYLHSLDIKSAELYSSVAAPDYIICELFALDGRNMFLDMPQVWDGIRRNYRLIKHTDKLALLEKSQRTNIVVKLSNTKAVQQGEWIDTSLLRGRQIAIHWPATSIGKLLSILLRNDMTFLTIEYADGAIRKYRVLPDTLQAPFDLDRIPRNFEDVISALSETPDVGMRVQRIRFDSNYGFYYPQEIILLH